LKALTPSEAAVIAGASVRDVHWMIDGHILPEALYSATQTCSFNSEACALISFYVREESRLTSEQPRRTITRASQTIPELQTILIAFPLIRLGN
jgi:hypothetical protein